MCPLLRAWRRCALGQGSHESHAKSRSFADYRPRVVGFTGGKDSTALVQLLYYMLARLPADQRRKHVYVLASGTRVEAP